MAEQKACEGPCTSEERCKIVDEIDRAVQRRDVDAVLKHVADDCVVELVGVRLTGKAGVRRWINWLYRTASTLSFSCDTMSLNGSTVWKEYDVHAKLRNGNSVRAKQVALTEFRGDKVQSIRVYFDRLAYAEGLADDFVSRRIVREMVDRSLEGLQ
jgi:ketosteroid isomerase-like protein